MELDFSGEIAFFAGFLNYRYVLYPFFRTSKFFPLETFVSPKTWRANEQRPLISHKNENTIFSSGNRNAKSGFETEKHLFSSNSSFANSESGLKLNPMP
jgi:hypothetical protein